MSRGVQVEGVFFFFFNSFHYGQIGKNSIQPNPSQGSNPTHANRVGPWVGLKKKMSIRIINI